MNKFKKIKSRMKWLSLTLLSLLIVLSFTSVTYAEWNHGIGTGFFWLNLDGDMGINTTLAGPIEIEVDLDPDDISDFLETAFGFSGYSTDGTWMIWYSFMMMELEGRQSQTLPANSVLPAGHSLSSTINFESTGLEVTVGYPVYKDPSVTIRVDGGLRYTKHEIDSRLGISGPSLNSTLTRNIEESWTDFLIGTTITVPLAKKWIWNTSANAGFGGSEGTYMGKTGIIWRFYKGWSTTLYGRYTAVEFEEASMNDSNWYLYDVDEYGLGLSIAYNW